MDFDNIGDLNEHGGDNPGFSGAQQKNVKRSQESQKYFDFLQANDNGAFPYKNADAYSKHLGEKLFKEALSRFGDQIRNISSSDFNNVASVSKRRAVSNYRQIVETINRARQNFKWIADGASGYEDFANVVGDFGGVVSELKRHEADYIRDGLAKIKEKLESVSVPLIETIAPGPDDMSNGPRIWPRRSENVLQVWKPNFERRDHPRRAGLPAEIVNFSFDYNEYQRSLPLAFANAGWFVDQFLKSGGFDSSANANPEQRFETSTVKTPVAPIPESSDFWQKNGDNLRKLVLPDIQNNGTKPERSLRDALKTLGLVVKESDIKPILARVVQDLGIVVEEETQTTVKGTERAASHFAEERRRREKVKRGKVKEFLDEVSKLGLDTLGLNIYDEDTASGFVSRKVTQHALRTVDTFVKLRHVPEYKNISLKALGRVAAERNMPFNPAYVKALRWTNPDDELDQVRPGQDLIDFAAIANSTLSSNSGKLDFFTGGRNDVEKNRSKKRSPVNAGERLFYDLTESIGRYGVIGKAGGVVEALRNYFANKEKSPDKFIEVETGDIKSVLEGVIEDIKSATVGDSVDFSMIKNPEVYRLASSGKNYLNVAYDIARERKRNAGYFPERAIEASSFSLGLGRIGGSLRYQFGRAQNSVARGWELTKGAAYQTFRPITRTAQSVWNAVVDDYRGIQEDNEAARLAELERRGADESKISASRARLEKIRSLRTSQSATPPEAPQKPSDDNFGSGDDIVRSRKNDSPPGDGPNNGSRFGGVAFWGKIGLGIAAVGAFALAIKKAAGAVAQFGTKTLETVAKYAPYSGGIMEANAVYQTGDFWRNVNYAQGVEKSTSELLDAWGKLKDASLDTQIAFKNLYNELGVLVIDAIIPFISVLSDFLKRNAPLIDVLFDQAPEYKRDSNGHKYIELDPAEMKPPLPGSQFQNGVLRTPADPQISDKKGNVGETEFLTPSEKAKRSSLAIQSAIDARISSESLLNREISRLNSTMSGVQEALQQGNRNTAEIVRNTEPKTNEYVTNPVLYKAIANFSEFRFNEAPGVDVEWKGKLGHEKQHGRDAKTPENLRYSTNKGLNKQ